jgi:7,8-dihydro-6-hydroxymethylpterin-pyrophosphokinase
MIKASTVMTYEELNNWMKAIEREAFRCRHCVTLDLDILLYGTKRYHEKDWTRPYVQLLLPDVGIM